jgi:hypothetical protein
MNMDRELERLAAVYAENDDEQLLDMYERREDLTEVAQAALAKVMGERGVVPGSVDVPEAGEREIASEDEGARAMADALDPGEVCVWNFDDAFRLKEALTLLTEAGIEQRVLNWNEVDPANASKRSPATLGLIVWREDLEQATEILHEKLGLFPEPESDETFEYVLGFVPIGTFSRVDAQRIAGALAEGGFSYVWDDETEDSNRSSRSVSISVKGTREVKARDWLEEKLGGLPFEAED